MPVINVLPTHLADMIAAGEVVERPASVIKELLENSFDAGARNITVEIRNGGCSYIRVTDDGCGMAPEDAGVAFLRHATSKLHDEKGLEAIATMGFRGEALAAISAVSKIELRTRRHEDSEGVCVELTAGEITDMYTTGCPAGTTMTVRDLFYNTPARQKFMKSDRSESSACQTAALRCALARPDVSVRFVSNGETVFFSPGDGSIDACVYAVLGRELSRSLLPCSSDSEGSTVKGFVSSPSAGRGNRSQQFFFCNRRFIKSPLLQSALEQAYRNTLLTGRYPSCVLYLDINFASVDVNVHPAKTEVRFSDEKKIFDLVYYAVLSALAEEKASPEVELPAASPSVSGAAAPAAKESPSSSDFYRSMSAAEYRSGTAPKKPASGKSGIFYSEPSGTRPASTSGAAPSVSRAPAAEFTPSYSSGVSSAASGNVPAAPVSPEPRPSKEEKPVSGQRSVPDMPVSPSEPPLFVSEPALQPDTGTASCGSVEKTVQNVEKPACPAYRFIGETMKTYILVESEGSLILIDKHAAHERMIFDRLIQNRQQAMSQSLLEPVSLHLSDRDCELVDENLEFLQKIGFEIEPFGLQDYIIRSVPADMYAGDAAAALEEICEKIRKNGGRGPETLRDDILHTVACKAAIKAGWDNSKEELTVLAEKVLSGEIKYCPHGRPVSVTLTRTELDRQFKRIV